METELISLEKIKPTTPTPDHLRIYKISLFDQFIAPMYTPLVLYFSGGGRGDEESIRLLKDSLSATFATFYPVAGVNRDSLSIDCNDEGVPFSVAKVKGKIRDFLQNPNLQLTNNLFPTKYDPEIMVAPGESLMMIQANCFDCGGIALSIIFAHFVADLSSISTFLQSWAANARGFGEQVPATAMKFSTAQSSFPQLASMTMESSPFYALMKLMTPGRFTMRRYMFDATALSTLKAAEARSPAGVPTPTRVDVVTAVIWKCFMTAVAAAGEEYLKVPFLMMQTVNMRKRAAPPFPKDSFGNFLWPAWALCTDHEKKGLKELVAEVKKAIAKIDSEFLKRMEVGVGDGDGDGEDRKIYEFFEEWRNEIPKEAKWLGFSSWVNNGLYDVDFGWGRPVWVSTTGMVAHDSESEGMFPNNMVMLMDRRDGDGIEAWVNIDKKYVEGFERNELIRKYARVNPSVV